jgi:tryptophan synthase beta chain
MMASHHPPITTDLPDSRGYFGEFGGRFVPETLMAALEDLTAAYESVRSDPTFQQRFWIYWLRM